MNLDHAMKRPRFGLKRKSPRPDMEQDICIPVSIEGIDNLGLWGEYQGQKGKQ